MFLLSIPIDANFPSMNAAAIELSYLSYDPDIGRYRGSETWCTYVYTSVGEAGIWIWEFFALGLFDMFFLLAW